MIRIILHIPAYCLVSRLRLFFGLFRVISDFFAYGDTVSLWAILGQFRPFQPFKMEDIP